MKPFAFLTLEKTAENGAKCSSEKEVTVAENSIVSAVEFDPYDFSDPIRRLRLLDSESNVVSKKSRVSNHEKMRFLDTVDLNCMTTEWSDWTKCSSSCGNGLRRRLRHYKNPDLARRHLCSQILEDTEMCLSENGECEWNEEGGEETLDECLMVNKWSSWSPCSASCGKGVTIRTRSFNDASLAEKCDVKLVEKKECVVAERCLDEDLMSYDEIRRICSLKKKPGPCRMTKSNVKFYFDVKAKKCLSFEYGGCRGNENNFDELEKCEATCGRVMRGGEVAKIEEKKPKKVVSKEFVTEKKSINLIGLIKRSIIYF